MILHGGHGPLVPAWPGARALAAWELHCIGRRTSAVPTSCPDVAGMNVSLLSTHLHVLLSTLTCTHPCPPTHSLTHSLTRRTASSYGFDMRCIKSLAMAEPLVDTVEPNQVCSSTALLRTFDITTMTKEDATFESDFKLKLTRCVHCARAGTVACNYAVAEGALSAFTQSG